MDLRRLRVLAIEDSEVDASILERYLAKVPGLDVEFLHCDDPDDVASHLSDPAIDLVFLDYNLGAMDGIEVLRAIRDAGDARPVVMLTGEGDEYIAARSVRAGADEYIVKSDVEPGALARVIASAEAESQRARKGRGMRGELDQLARENDELRSMAMFDELTGVATRRHFQERLGGELRRARRHGHELCVLMLDLDHFKQINDGWGHPTGDCVLARVGSVLRESLRGSDLPARLGGDEFCAILPNADQDSAVMLAERIRAALSAQPLVTADGVEIRLTCSIGVAALDAARDDLESLLARADAALYQAKHAGRDGVATQPPDCG